MATHRFLQIVTLATVLFVKVRGHGRLIEPPGRSSMWRYGYNNPINYDDNQLFCGGFDRQWNQNGGLCGVCGDPYDGQRDNEAGGKYANGIIVRNYTEGAIINVYIDLTTSHLGWFEFRLCPNNDIHKPVTQECLDMNLLESPKGYTRYNISSWEAMVYELQVRLPPGISTCSQCVLQWKYNAGNSWGCDEDNNCCVGCGPQEQFYGCADIAIHSSRW
ncbi:uncharacterized protein LOC101851474 [Aplysia californica]|uniref:Uncharacterized protein LOC101851474 n=1 Tax=Aplysia californica TaxID=6500 RepID=A0ABM0JF29_APLCA|nr:uncharacterized protein LOC101851474 [Aplysia californica]